MKTGLRILEKSRNFIMTRGSLGEVYMYSSRSNDNVNCQETAWSVATNINKHKQVKLYSGCWWDIDYF